MMIKKFNRFDKKKLTSFFLTTLCLVACMSFTAFCAEGDFDINTTMTTVVADIAKTLMSGIGIVVTGIAGFLGAKIAVVKIVSFLKTMTGKA